MKTPSSSMLLDLTCMVLFPIGFVLILKSLSFLLIPFLMALLFCYVIGLPLDYLHRHQVPAPVRILLTVVLLLGIIYALEILIQRNLASLLRSWPEFEQKFWIYAGYLLNRLEITEAEARETIQAFFSNLGSKDLKPIGVMVQYLSGSLFSFLGSAFWVLLFVVFILSERGALARKIVKGFGPDRAINILNTMRTINISVQQYLGLKTVISLLTGILVGVILSVLQVPFAFLWGLLAFVLNYIPNIGSVVAGIPPILITLFDSGSVFKTLVVTAAFVFIQAMVGNVVEPRVLGKGLNLSPLVVLLSLLFWGWLWGISGMLLSVPLTAALKIAMDQFKPTRPLAILLGDNPRA